MDAPLNNIEISDNLIGPGCPCFIIAEIAQAHDGSLGTAHAYIDAVAKTGVNAIKFQTHIADAESTQDEKFRVNIFPQDKTRYEYWKRMEFTPEQWAELSVHAAEKGLIFLSTPFSLEAVDLLNSVNIKAWKIGSGEIADTQLLEYVNKTNKPILLSSGMSTWKELDAAVNIIKKFNNQFAIFQCTTSYPCPPEKLGINIMQEIKERYSCPVGLSDHSGTIFGSFAAAARSANILEVHAVFSRDCFGPDVTSSVTIEELSKLVEGVRFIEKACASIVSKDESAEELTELKRTFGKSLVATHDLNKGHVLTKKDIAFKKPGTGISIDRAQEFLGKKLTKSYSKNQQLKELDFE